MPAPPPTPTLPRGHAAVSGARPTAAARLLCELVVAAPDDADLDELLVTVCAAFDLPEVAVPHIWTKVLAVADTTTRRVLAELPVPVPVALALVDDPDEWVATTAATNAAHHGRWPDVVIDAAAHSRHERARVQVAGGRITPVETLELLSEDPSEWVRELVGANPRTPAAIVERFARGCQEERLGVASNPEADRELLEQLSADPDEWVAADAAATLRDLAAAAR